MKYFFQHWVDLTAMILSFVAAVSVAAKLSRVHPVRGLAVFFFLFGPLVIGVHMFFHLFNVTYNITERIRAQAFVYDFRVYSLYLMGAVLGYLSLRLLGQGMVKCRNLHRSNKPMYKTMAAISLISLPTVFFTPIGSLPAMACIVSLAAMQFIRRRSAVVAKINSVTGDAVAI